ncbi:hypothetical protein EVAR_12447_1 [Eumeta japonica]|uniref:Uncharacterized protein n=1 Tax=Eumeta variegata TaxID=151549 RepID=A0A4C1TZB1_EUMVA|nr:hypothetical protein EVAR_12447_1 [Eumeta japonica]
MTIRAAFLRRGKRSRRSLRGTKRCTIYMRSESRRGLGARRSTRAGNGIVSPAARAIPRLCIAASPVQLVPRVLPVHLTRRHRLIIMGSIY